MTLLELPLEVIRDILEIAINLDTPYHVVRLRSVCCLFDVEIMRSLVRTKIDWHQWDRSARISPEMAVKFLSHRLLQDGPLQSAFHSTLDFITKEQKRQPSLGTQDYSLHLLNAAIRNLPALPQLLDATFPAKEPNFAWSGQSTIEKARHNALVAVASAGDVTFVRHLLDTYESGPSYRGGLTTLGSPFFGSPLHGAVTSGNEEVFKVLRTYGVKISTSDQKYLSGTVEQYIDWKAWSALADASAFGHYSIVRMLLGLGKPEPDVSDYIGAALVAVQRGYSDAIDVFLDIGRRELNQIDAEGLNAEQRILSHACRYGHAEIVKKMLDRGVDPNFEAGRGTLYLAAGSGDLTTMKLLYQRGAILGRQGKRQRYRTELAVAAVHGHYNAMDLLISWGLAVNDWCTRLDAEDMVWRGHCTGIQCLISRGFELSNLVGKDGSRGSKALVSAAWNGREGIVDVLLRIVGINPNPPLSSPPHMNALYAALESRHYRIARMLLAHGAKRIKLPTRFVSSYYGVLHQASVINKAVRNPCGCNCKLAENGVSWGMGETLTWHHQRREEDDEVLALALACKEDVVRGKRKPPQLGAPVIHKEHVRMDWIPLEDLPLDFMQN